MATLQQTLRGLPKADDQLTRGPGGVLQRSPTLQEATKQAGLVAAPTTPMAAQMTGASQQAAKMAGTPQQLQAALQQSTEQPTLQTALRQKQYGREVTGAEAGAMTKSADMQKLGGLGDRVTNMIQGEFKKPVATDVDLSNDLDILREELKKDPTGKSQAAMDAMLRIVQSGQNLDDVTKLIPEAATAIANVAAKSIRDPKTVKAAEFLPDLGYDENSLAELLGVTPEELREYSVEDLQNKVNQVASQEFTKTQQLQQQAASSLVGAAERSLAREAARELSAVGVRASEADMQRLANEISTAEQVTLFGQTRSITDWLADDNVSAMIKDVVESPEGSPLRKSMEAEAPGLYQFITRNETILKEAAAALGKGTAEFQDIQAFNKEQFKGLSDAAIAVYAPGATDPRSKRITAEDFPILAYRAGLSDADRQIVDNELNMLQAKNPAMAAKISKLTVDELAALGIGKPGSNYDKMIKYNQNIDNIDAIPDMDGNAIISAVYSDVGSVRAANELIDDNNALVAMGYPSGVSATAPIDPKQIKKDVIASNPKVSLADAVAGNVPAGGKREFGQPKYPEDVSEQMLFTVLKPIMKDGSLSAEEINDPKGPVSKLSWDDIIMLRKMADKPGAKIDKAALDARLNQFRAENTGREFLAVGGADRRNTDPALDIDRWAKLLNSDPNKVDHAMVRDLITRTAIGEFQSGTYRDRYAEGTLDRLKNLGLLTPEIISEFNKYVTKNYENRYWAIKSQLTATQGVSDKEKQNLKLEADNRYKKNKAYPYGIDASGNPLPPPPSPSSSSKNMVKLQRGSRTVEVEATNTEAIDSWKRAGYRIV